VNVATNRATQAERQKKYPVLWSLAETFLRRYGGKVHINWGTPFSIRTKVAEGRLEVDFGHDHLNVRFEHTPLPPQVSFTNDSNLFSGHLFNQKMDGCALELGWVVQGGDDEDASMARAFLEEPANIEDLKRLGLGKGESISLDAAGIFLAIRTAEFARLASIIEAAQAMLRRFAAIQPRADDLSSVRVTGKSPSPVQLKQWPNWSVCSDEEDQEGQDETTLRPDTEQTAIGPKTILTAVDIELPGQLKLIGSLLSDLPGEGLLNASPGVLTVFEKRSTLKVLIKDDSWSPFPAPERTVECNDPKRLPMVVRSVLPFRGGERLVWVLESHGTLRK
jgi:hypothetical protein